MGTQRSNHAAVHETHDVFATMALVDTRQSARGASNQLGIGLGARDDTPLVGAVELQSCGVFIGQHVPEQPAFPVAQEHLAQVMFFGRFVPKTICERLSCLMRTDK